MKKVLMIALLVIPMAVMAQTSSDEAFAQGTPENPSFKNRRGLEMLPQAGDWSLGIDASTGLEYFGNMLNGNSSNTNSDWWEYQESAAPRTIIQGKYFTSATFAYRAGIDINYSDDVDYFQIADDNATASPDKYVDDVRKISSFGLTLLAGVEKRKGTGRIQGVYGADVYFSFASNTKYSLDYANAITESNQEPSSTAFGTNPAGASTVLPSQGYRVTESKRASDFGVGARGFIGVEYFVFPKMSLGGKFTWGISYTDQGVSSVSSEAWNAQSNKVEEYTLESKEGYNFNAGIGNAGASITAFFYF